MLRLPRLRPLVHRHEVAEARSSETLQAHPSTADRRASWAFLCPSLTPWPSVPSQGVWLPCP